MVGMYEFVVAELVKQDVLAGAVLLTVSDSSTTCASITSVPATAAECTMKEA